MLWWLVSKIIALVMIAAGGFLVFFFPGISGQQEAGASNYPQTNFGLAGIVIGLVLIIAGGFLLFSQ
ncbi:MAG: hypothetical protein V1648_04005 [Candidatus Aenigmatarchaeota archaeon]